MIPILVSSKSSLLKMEGGRHKWEHGPQKAPGQLGRRERAFSEGILKDKCELGPGREEH